MNPMRYHECCPSCGFVLTEIESAMLEKKPAFDCPRCKAHYALKDFNHEMQEKRMAQFHNHAKADLTQEEQE